MHRFLLWVSSNKEQKKNQYKREWKEMYIILIYIFQSIHRHIITHLNTYISISLSIPQMTSEGSPLKFCFIRFNSKDLCGVYFARFRSAINYEVIKIVWWASFVPCVREYIGKGAKLVLFRRTNYICNDIAAPKILPPKGLNIIQSKDMKNISKIWYFIF